MAEHITKTPGTYDEIDIRCPKCDSHNVTIVESSRGYYEIVQCYGCGYNKSPEIMP